MENPEALSSPDIESSDVALHILFTHRNAAGFVRRSDDHRVARDDRCGMESDVRAQQIDFLIILQLQIDATVPAEARYHIAGLRIERDQPVTRRDIEDSFFSAVTPIRQSASGQLA